MHTHILFLHNYKIKQGYLSLFGAIGYYLLDLRFPFLAVRNNDGDRILARIDNELISIRNYLFYRISRYYDLFG